MEISTTRVERHEPRNNRIISPVSAGGDRPLAHDASDGSQFGQVTQVKDPRLVQFALKFYF